MTQAETTALPYRIDVASLPDFEELVAEIYIDDHFVGLLSQESGPNRTVFELGPTKDSVPLKVDLAVFEQALAHAKARLKKMERRRPIGDGE
jgi:hypothetical protein